MSLRRIFRRTLRPLWYAGDRRYCPLCDRSFRRFRPHHRDEHRPEAKCPGCDSYERHRLAWRIIQARRHELLAGDRPKLLHVAPEPSLERKFREMPIDYVTADLGAGRAMVDMDIADIRYPDAAFDVIYCSHVLEHVPEDRAALREFFRVLKPGGWLVVAVPITVEVTVEDPSVTTPAERTRLYGQHDHVRRYGVDFTDRLRAAGFAIETIRARDVASPDDIDRMRLDTSQPVFLCRRPALPMPAARGGRSS